MNKIYHYAVEGYEGKGATVVEDPDGWLHFAGKLGKFYGQDNIFMSLEEMELIIGRKLRLVWSITDGKTVVTEDWWNENTVHE